MKLWIDDIRPAPVGWAWAKTSKQAIRIIKDVKKVDIISFDHDLGGDDTTRPVMIYIITNEIPVGEVLCHSANPVGREWILEMAKRYLQYYMLKI